MNIRPYHDADLEATVTLWYASWHAAFPDLTHPHTLERWRTRFCQELTPAFSIWVADLDGRVAGFMAVSIERGVLDQLFVHPSFQGQGVGAALLLKAKALCPAGLTLSTLEQNRRARALWEAHGFLPGARGLNAVNGQRTVEYRWHPGPLAGSGQTGGV